MTSTHAKLTQQILWTAIITPLTPQGKVDLKGLQHLISLQENAGNGIVLLGSTGEALNLSPQEKQTIVESVMQNPPQVPVILGVGGHDLNACLEWIQWSQKFSFAGYLLVTPIYAKPGLNGQVKWFKTLMDAAQKPCMLYNVPGRSAVAMHPQVLSELKNHPQLWALKEASGSVEKYSAFRQAHPELPIYSGDDGLCAFFASMGCAGIVSVASNVWPQETRKYTELCLKHQTTSLFPLWEKACNGLFWASNPIPVKALMYARKMISSPELKAPLEASDFKQIEELFILDALVREWGKKHS
jgi:4-hydroxy-tetrahydrodipicolinate synthase